MSSAYDVGVFGLIFLELNLTYLCSGRKIGFHRASDSHANVKTVECLKADGCDRLLPFTPKEGDITTYGCGD